MLEKLWYTNVFIQLIEFIVFIALNSGWKGFEPYVFILNKKYRSSPCNPSPSLNTKGLFKFKYKYLWNGFTWRRNRFIWCRNRFIYGRKYINRINLKKDFIGFSFIFNKSIYFKSISLNKSKLKIKIYLF